MSTHNIRILSLAFAVVALTAGCSGGGGGGGGDDAAPRAGDSGSGSNPTAPTTPPSSPPASSPPSAPPPSNPAPIGAAVTSFTLTSTVGGTQPFTVGLGFKAGEVNAVPTLDVADQQVVVMRRWKDGTVKHAVASGHVVLAANTPKTITVQNSASGSGGSALTAASIASANPQASIQFGSLGTVSLQSLLAAPFRTFVNGPEMVEAHYRAAVGTDPTLVAWFHVRLYKSGKLWVRAIGENGYLDVNTASKSYVPAVTIGGAAVWNNGGATLTHHAHTRWAQEGWIGGDPQLTPKHDTAYLKSTRLVPNYLGRTPSAATLNGLYQAYAPNQRGNWTQSMGDTGFQDQIGLLPLWDALYITSGADARAYKSVLANTKALNSYAIVWNDSATKLPVRPSTRATWSFDGPNQGGGSPPAAGQLAWEGAHHGSGGYMCYLITADYFCLETMQQQAALNYLGSGSTNYATDPPSSNFGTSRVFNSQTRFYAWAMRTLSQYAGIAPATDPLLADYQAQLANNIANLKRIQDTVVPAGSGYLYEYESSLYGPGLVAPWQQHFFMQSLGMGSDLEPLDDMAEYRQVRDYMYRGVVGILGNASGYCFTHASAYNIKSNNASANQANAWYKNWSQVYSATFTTAPACGNTLLGDSAGEPGSAAGGYWGNLIPAAAYAVDHGAAGAADSWARLTGATNWQTVLNSGFGDIPIFGIVPR